MIASEAAGDAPSSPRRPVRRSDNCCCPPCFGIGGVPRAGFHRPTMVPGVPAPHATSMNRCRAVRSLAAGAEPVAVSGSAAPVTALPTEAAVADRPWVVTGVLVSRREFLQPSGLGAAGT